MTYPIFNSFVNLIERELNNKKLNLKTLKTWSEDRINATGLEILFETEDENNFIKEVSINFDWDRFRETILAQQLKGLSEHPMLQKSNLKSVTVSPQIDIEMSWIFDEQKSQITLPHSSGSMDNFQNASRWMEQISQNVNDLLAEDDVITRWHIEIEGNHKQRKLTEARLISYFQYPLTEIKSLNEAHSFVKMRVNELMVKSQKVRQIADNTLADVA